MSSLPFEHVYAQVQQFYARQMQLLDDGAAQEWANTFTAGGSFQAPSLPEPVRGREALAAGVRKAAAGLAAAGETHRHWLGMINVVPQADGSLRVRCYAHILAVPHGGEPRPHLSCVCSDVLVYDGGELRVRQRQVTRDDRP